MKQININLITGNISEINVPDMEVIPTDVILPVMNILTKYQFMNRLTVPERIAIFELESTDSMVKMWLEMFKIADEIDVTNAETIAGINMLAQLGVITSDRVQEILK